MYENEEIMERALLVAVDLGEYDIEASLDELAELAQTAGIETVARLTQKRTGLNNATCIGSGKLEEMAAFVQSEEVNIVIFDHELSATQIRNLEKVCAIPVIDRTMLILEIFSQHANTSEGRVQVELARHRYLLPRLSGMNEGLSRLGGGGGGGSGARRGAGETRLEINRRTVRRNMQKLSQQLAELEARRNMMRQKRRKDGVSVVAIMGYTNVGKSTLLNKLTDAGVLTEDKLFATLDPTARALSLPDGRNVMLIDTVGLVRRLPHHLVEAFKSTLEEALFADLLLNVCDISNPEYSIQAEVTNRLLEDLGVGDTPVLTVLNKADKNPEPPLAVGKNAVVISAKTGAGLEDLLQKICVLLEPRQKKMLLLLPYDKSGLITQIKEEGKILSQEYVEEGIRLEAMVDYRLYSRAEPFLCE